MPMLSLKVLAALLDYPTAEIVTALAEMRVILAGEGRLSAAVAARLDEVMAEMAVADLLDLQADWVDQFDRTRSLSLNLFEHVHGESRDRGQAMVDLQAMYQARGLDIGVSELPDYLPVFLEFLSILPEGEATDLLGEAAHVVAALAERLTSRGSAYAAVMAAVAELAGAPELAGKPLSTPEKDADIDIAWAEEPIEFGAGSALAGCGATAPMRH